MSIAILVKQGQTIDTTAKTPAWFAIKDANRKNADNYDLHTSAAIKHGERIHAYVQSIFPYNRTYLNFRKKFISVKVEGVSLEQAQSTHAHIIEDLCALSNVSIVGHGTNIIFRVTN